jgi:hypothetical protein
VSQSLLSDVIKQISGPQPALSPSTPWRIMGLFPSSCLVCRATGVCGPISCAEKVGLFTRGGGGAHPGGGGVSMWAVPARQRAGNKLWETAPERKPTTWKPTVGGQPHNWQGYIWPCMLWGGVGPRFKLFGACNSDM